MDLHKQLARDVRSKAERDRGILFLQRNYSDAIRGTEWEQLSTDLKAGQNTADPDDGLELYEIEGRGVGVFWPDQGFGSAWVWAGGWRSAPGLVNKSWLEGHRLTQQQFTREFPEADLGNLKKLAAERIVGPSNESGEATSATDPQDEFDHILRGAVGAWASARCLRIAKKVGRHMRKMPPSGMFDCDDHRNVWDEYRLQAQSGPPALEWAWSATVDPMIDYEAERLTLEEAVLITLWNKWLTDELKDLDTDNNSPEDIRKCVLRALNDLAQEQR